MQEHRSRLRIDARLILFLIVIIFLAFLPVSSFLFFIKNDAFNSYFPAKFFISESIRAGHLPIWNPYINFGIPQYGDMNAGFWSPLTWLISLLGGYNAYSFTIEILSYSFIGAAGMYLAAGMFTDSRTIRIIAAISYGCSGYFVHHMQHVNWVSGAAFVPWCIYTYWQMTGKRSMRALTGCVLAFYLFLASAHPGLIISGLYFFMAFAIFLFFQQRKKGLIAGSVFPSVRLHFAFIILLTLLSAGLILGYTDVFTHFTRNGKASMSSATGMFFPAQQWLSFLFPFAVMKGESFYQLDISMRNYYIGLPVFVMALAALGIRGARWVWFFAATAFFFLLLSMHGGFGKIMHDNIPLIGLVRLHGEFRMYAMFSLIMLAVIGLENLTGTQDAGLYRRVVMLFRILLGVAGVTFLMAIVRIISGSDSLLHHFPAKTGSTTSYLKAVIDGISFSDTWLIESLCQATLLYFALKFTKERNLRRLCWLVMIDMIFHANLVIPYAVAGQAPLSAIEHVIEKSPAGIPIPPLQPIRNNSRIDPAEEIYIGQWSMFNKQIGTTQEHLYPIQLPSTRDRFDRLPADSSEMDKPFLYLAHAEGGVRIINFKPGDMIMHVSSAQADTLVIQQNFYHRWRAFTGRKREPLVLYNGHDLGIPVSAGEQDIRVSFVNGDIRLAMIISVLVCILLVIVLFTRRRNVPVGIFSEKNQA